MAHLARPARDIDLEAPRMDSAKGDVSSAGTPRSSAVACSEADSGITSAAEEKNKHAGTLWQLESFADRYSPVKAFAA